MRRYALVAAAIFGNLIANVGVNLHRHIHYSIETYRSDIPYYKIPAWWAGLLLIFIGELGNFFAYGFAPVVMVAPLGIVSVLTNFVYARFWQSETFHRFEGIGIGCAVVAAAILLTATPATTVGLMGELFTEFTYSPPFFIFMFLVLAVYIGMGVCIGYESKKQNILIWVFMSSLMGSLTVMFAKGLSFGVFVTVMGGEAFHWPTTWINLFSILIATTLQTITVTKALKVYRSSVFIPLYFLIFNLCSVSASLMLLNEWTTSWRLGAYFLFIVFCVGGVFFFTYVQRVMSALATANRGKGPRGELALYPLLHGEDAASFDELSSDQL